MANFYLGRLLIAAGGGLIGSSLRFVIEIVDTGEKIEAFLPFIEEAVPEGVTTLEKVAIRFYRNRK